MDEDDDANVVAAVLAPADADVTAAGGAGNLTLDEPGGGGNIPVALVPDLPFGREREDFFCSSKQKNQYSHSYIAKEEREYSLQCSS